MRTKSRPLKEKPPADFEEVKRRFTRQNRDLARANSTQALHIQNLKNEAEKLVAQNQALKELVVRLQGELVASRTHAATVKTKVTELMELMSGGGNTQGHGHEVDQEILSKQCIKSPTPRQFRERQPLAELLQETQMPTINEHKSYPRRTLDTEDIWTVRLSDHSSNESPDLGPPPVAHFECEEPVRLGNDEASPVPEDEMRPVENELLLASVETRRKKKDAPSRLEMRRSSFLAESPVRSEGENASLMLRTSAKRKLSDRESDKPVRPPSQDDFTFVRRSPVKFDVENDSINVVNSKRMQPGAHSPERLPRRVLGNKSVNMSPRKVSTTAKAEKPTKKDVKEPAHKRERPISVASRRSSAALPLPSPPREHHEEIVLPTVEIPAPSDEHIGDDEVSSAIADPAMDFFSPPPSLEVPDRRSRDTPPPSDISALSANTTSTSSSSASTIASDANANGGAARASRRARSAVNYAEPSLIAKMRRPGKEMVDAISGLQDPRCVMTTTGERRSVGGASASEGTPAPTTGSAASSARRSTTAIKIEPRDDEDDYDHDEIAVRGMMAKTSSKNDEPGSPLREKSASASADTSRQRSAVDSRRLSSSLSMPELARQPLQSESKPSSTTSSQQRSSRLSASGTSGSSTTISALLAANPPQARKRRDSSQSGHYPPQASTASDDDDDDDVFSAPTAAATASRRKREELDLYDFKDSSSSSLTQSSLLSLSSSPASKQDNNTVNTSGVLTQGRISRRHSSAPKELNARAAIPAGSTHSRRSMMVVKTAEEEDPMSTEGAIEDGRSDGASLAGRAERVAVRRRRSMMI